MLKESELKKIFGEDCEVTFCKDCVLVGDLQIPLNAPDPLAWALADRKRKVEQSTKDFLTFFREVLLLETYLCKGVIVCPAVKLTVSFFTNNAELWVSIETPKFSLRQKLTTIYKALEKLI